MSNFKNCVFLNAEKARSISKWIVLQMNSGLKTPEEMYQSFYVFISDQVIPQEQIVFLDTFGSIYSELVTVYKKGSDQEKAWVQNTSVDDLLAIDQALDSADDINLFIEHNFINGNLPELLKAKVIIEPEVKIELQS
jgi:hypothetical protein